MIRRSAWALGAGLLTALALPPWGWWPLAPLGLAIFQWRADAAPSRRARSAMAWWFTTGWLGLGLAWMWFFSIPGYLAAVILFAALHAGAEALVGGPTVVTRPAMHVVAEGLRAILPFGGVPLATLAIGHADGPLAFVVRLGGPVLLGWCVWQIGALLGSTGVHLVGLMRRGEQMPWRPAAAAGSATVVVCVLAALAPSGATNPAGPWRVAAVQGGGPQGQRAIHSDPEVVFRRHLEATRVVPRGTVDAVLWPENIISVPHFAGSPELAEVAARSRALGVPMIVSVTEDASPEHFVNAQVVVTPDGQVTDRYEKVRRVPFGEYMPLRGLLHALGAPTDLVPRDAIEGQLPTRLALPDGVVLAPAISWEIFFADRVADGIDHGGEVISNPTNGSSYTWTLVQTQQCAASRLRAVEQGRWVIQAAPTGFSAFVDPHGTVHDRSKVGEATVITGTVTRYRGRTWFSHLGEWPWLLAALGVGGGVGVFPVLSRRRGSRSPDRR